MGSCCGPSSWSLGLFMEAEEGKDDDATCEAVATLLSSVVVRPLLEMS